MSQSNVIEVISPDGGRKEISLQKSIVFIGSDPHVDVPLVGVPGIASRHLQLIAVPDAGCRLVNLGNSEVFLGAANEKGLAPHSSTEVADGESIKIGNFVLIFHSGSQAVSDTGPVGLNTSSQSRHIGLSLTLPQTRLAPHRTLEGIVTVSNLGDIAGVQFELELEGFGSDYYELEPGPLLSSGAEKEVLFRLYHRGAKPLAGNYHLTIYATAPRAYPAEQSSVSQVIEVQPLYQHKLTIVSPAGAKPVPPPPSPVVALEPVQPKAVEVSPPVTPEPVRPVEPPPPLPVVPETVQPVSLEPTLPSVPESVQPAIAEPVALLPAPASDELAAAPPSKPSSWWARLFGFRQKPHQTIESVSPTEAVELVEIEPSPLVEVEVNEQPVEIESPSPVDEEPVEVVDVQSRVLADIEPTPAVPEIEVSAPELALPEVLPSVAQAAPVVDIQPPEPTEVQAALPPAEIPPEPAEIKAPLLTRPKLVSPTAQSDDWWASPIETAPQSRRGEQDQKKNEPAPDTTPTTPPEQVSKSKEAASASTAAASTPPADDWWASPVATEPPRRRVLKVKAAPASETEETPPAASQAKAEDWWTSEDNQDAEDELEDG